MSIELSQDEISRLANELVADMFSTADKCGIALAFDPNEPRDESGQWTQSGGGKVTSKDGKGKGGNTEHKKVVEWTKKFARQKIKNAPVPTTEQITKARAELKLAAEGKGRAGGDARGGSAAARRKQRENLFNQFGGDKRGWICCHGCGRRLHHNPPPKSNLERLERGKIFVKCQGGGYQLPNLLPECFQCNRSRNANQIRKDIKC
jgi:hypothetical protein